MSGWGGEGPTQEYNAEMTSVPFGPDSLKFTEG